MILVDTSVWIDLFGKNKLFHISPDQLLTLGICSPVLQEVLQGVREDSVYHRVKESLLALPHFGSPVKLEDYLAAADIYRQGRKKGHTIRSSTDCLIAAIAIRCQVSVWHNDRDFTAIAKYTALQIYKAPSQREGGSLGGCR